MWACCNRLTGCIPLPTWSLYQSMSWLKSLQAFFVRCAELVPSPCCGETLSVIGSRKRKVINENGEHRLLVVRRLRCSQCRKIHHELPDCIVPYKRYESECIELVVSEPAQPPAVAADDATLRRWKRWFREQTAYLLGALRSIASAFIRTLVRLSADCTSSFRTFCWGCPRLAGAYCPPGCKCKFMVTYPFCLLVRLCAAVNSLGSLPSEVQE